MKVSCALLAAIAEASHGSTGAVTYTGTYMRGVTVSIAGADPNPETGATRVKVSQTYSFRRDVAGFGDGCTQNDIDKNRSSKLIGPNDSLNSSKYQKGQARFLTPDESDGQMIGDMMDEWVSEDDMVARVGDKKGLKEWKLKYTVTDLRWDQSGFEHDDWCMGSVEDTFEVDNENAKSFLFQNRQEGSPTWMVMVSDSSEIAFDSIGESPKYEKYRFGAALYDISTRSDTGKINQSPVAKLPGDFLMQANCKNSYKIEMSDPDGDFVKCRWAEVGETSKYAAHHRDVGFNESKIVSDFPSITLNTETCTVTYDGSLDDACTGASSQVFEHRGGSQGVSMKNAGANHCYKPFALIIEDFDANGNVLSSVPLTFFGQVVEKATCDSDNGDDDDDKAIFLDLEKQSAMLENFVTAPASDEWNINGARYNKIHLAAKFMDRFTTKFCGWGTLTQNMADDWYKTDSKLEQSGHDLLDLVLADCKTKVSTKAKTKWTQIVKNLDKMSTKIAERNAKKSN